MRSWASRCGIVRPDPHRSCRVSMGNSVIGFRPRSGFEVSMYEPSPRKSRCEKSLGWFVGISEI